jgi:hypothetical protein
VVLRGFIRAIKCQLDVFCENDIVLTTPNKIKSLFFMFYFSVATHRHSTSLFSIEICSKFENLSKFEKMLSFLKCSESKNVGNIFKNKKIKKLKMKIFRLKIYSF